MLLRTGELGDNSLWVCDYNVKFILHTESCDDWYYKMYWIVQLFGKAVSLLYAVESQFNQVLLVACVFKISFTYHIT